MHRLGTLTLTALLLAGCGSGGTEVSSLDDLANKVRDTGAMGCTDWSQDNPFGMASEAADCGNSADDDTDNTMIAIYPSSDAAEQGSQTLVDNTTKPVAYGPNWTVKGDGADKVADELGGKMAEPS